MSEYTSVSNSNGRGLYRMWVELKLEQGEAAYSQFCGLFFLSMFLIKRVREVCAEVYNNLKE